MKYKLLEIIGFMVSLILIGGYALADQAATWGVPQVGPATPSEMASRIQDSLDALLTAHRGTSRPSYVEAGTIWIDNVDATEDRVYFFDGSDDILLFVIDKTNNLGKHGILETKDITSAVSSTTFIGLEDEKRYRLEIEIDETIGDASSFDLYLRFGNSGGIDTGSNYSYKQDYIYGTTSTITNGTSQTRIRFFGGSDIIGASTKPMFATIEFGIEISDSTAAVGFSTTTCDGYLGVLRSNFGYDGASAIDRIQIYSENGTFVGNLRLYVLN